MLRRNPRPQRRNGQLGGSLSSGMLTFARGGPDDSHKKVGIVTSVRARPVVATHNAQADEVQVLANGFSDRTRTRQETVQDLGRGAVREKQGSRNRVSPQRSSEAIQFVNGSSGYRRQPL